MVFPLPGGSCLTIVPMGRAFSPPRINAGHGPSLQQRSALLAVWGANRAPFPLHGARLRNQKYPPVRRRKSVRPKKIPGAGRTSHPPSGHRIGRPPHGRTSPGALHAVRLIPSKSPWRRRAGSGRCSPPANRSRRPRPFRRTAFPAAPPGYIASPRGTTPPCRR